MEDANIRTAMEAEKEFVKDPMYITAYEQHQKYLRDKYARESFLRKEGEAKALKEFISALLASGMTEEDAARILKKSVEEIRVALK